MLLVGFIFFPCALTKLMSYLVSIQMKAKKNDDLSLGARGAAA